MKHLTRGLKCKCVHELLLCVLPLPELKNQFKTTMINVKLIIQRLRNMLRAIFVARSFVSMKVQIGVVFVLCCVCKIYLSSSDVATLKPFAHGS